MAFKNYPFSCFPSSPWPHLAPKEHRMHWGNKGVRELQTCTAHASAPPATCPSARAREAESAAGGTPPPPPGDPRILTPTVTWRRKRCAALSMLSRAAFCLCRARAAAPRAVWRPDQRRATAAATKQQARAAPRAPESAAHSSPSTIISHLAELPRAAENQHARAPPQNPAWIRRGSAHPEWEAPAESCAAAGSLGSAPLPGSGPEAGGAQLSRSGLAAG